MIGIIGAMKQEVAILKALIAVQEVKKIMHVEFTVGTLHGKEVVLLESGIGKVNVAIAVTLLLDKFNVSQVINTGSAGGINADAEIGNVVISDKISYHDVDVTAFGYALGQIPELPAAFQADDHLIAKAKQVLTASGTKFFVGQILTGDAFISRPEQLSKIKASFTEALALEMEAAAIAQVCQIANVPFIVMRALSDIAGKESQVAFEEFLPVAAKASSLVVEKLVQII